MGRFLDWLNGIGPDVAPSLSETVAEGFTRATEHSVYLAEMDVMNLSFPDGGIIRLHGVGQGSILIFVKAGDTK